MKAIILAAGVGRRLREYTEEPKCVLEINGKPLIQRYLEALQGVDIKEVAIVVGYKKEKVVDTVDKISFSGGVKFIENMEYERESILSLWKARDELNEEIVLMDGDVYFEQEVLKKLVESPFKNCLIIDTTSENRGEEVMAGVKDDKITALERNLKEDFDLIGEWVGFVKISKSGVKILKGIVKKVIANRDYKDYEEVLPQLFGQTEFNYELVDGLKWVEIDFKEDLEEAEKKDLTDAYD